jgi:P27 family predicted phage terminase small subunit
VGRPGPRPLPSNVVELRGNPGKRKRPAEPQPFTAADPDKPPAWLFPAARDVWSELAGEVARMGLLHKVDEHALAFGCVELALAQLALRKMGASARRNPSIVTADRAHGGEPRLHPALRAYRQHADGYLKWCKEFGLTPSSRVGLPAPDGDDGDEDEDLLND